MTCTFATFITCNVVISLVDLDEKKLIKYVIIFQGSGQLLILDRQDLAWNHPHSLSK